MLYLLAAKNYPNKLSFARNFLIWKMRLCSFCLQFGYDKIQSTVNQKMLGSQKSAFLMQKTNTFKFVNF